LLGFGPTRTDIDLSVWTGVKLGVGFAIGATLVVFLLGAIAVVVFGQTIAAFQR
jgi:hypothetical protein